ncbi:M1 family metallopeptidase [Reichenbachiella agarivorans]|uniref:M1 family metallopeptidase n=1 Tax=Reichenbachiella agarivorans TaxID=2979464 RepID=A0ABY6CU38_9BACT|nr:M1 family metallopeptidase [Reichenbachiella agarivorans]UXP34031.1 M1 family metallopeptidase [Reichenbachiella agarivorans]
MKRIVLFILALLPLVSQAQGVWEQKFEQLGTTLPTPNQYRTASGAPGVDYWQQKVDYVIDVELTDANHEINGSEVITYTNNSPDQLAYLWVQLDQNMRAKDSDTPLTEGTAMKSEMNGKSLQSLTNDFGYDGGFKIKYVKDAQDAGLKYTINKTMMRVDLPKPLKTGESVTFKIAWSYIVQDRLNMGGRSGYEYFPKDDNYLYTIAQWFPRLAVYDDVEGWQNKQFLGQGEFALEFGDYQVNLTVPSDFMVAATGTLQNPKEALTPTQLKRFEKAKKTFDAPVVIVTQEEATENEKSRATSKKTWSYKADNVRDFAFATSRKFIWDAQAVKLGDKTPLAMSYYPKEGNPLWGDESTKAVVNTLITYSKHTVEYPYPVAISVHTAAIGMEYPMICFNYGRPDENGEFSDRLKWGMIGVIIHEVGHNFFPMIINSDERQWTWMDEGLNTFVQSLTEKAFYPEKPLRRGEAKLIVDYMKGDKMFIRPIMTNSEQIIQFGNNAYGKPAAALSVLRETIMGPELFDYAFKTYSERWAFKHPSPADFFRTMEDASAVDLDWFWKGWFYSTDHVDVSLDKVTWYKMGVPEEETVEDKPKKGKKDKKVSEGTATDGKVLDFAEEAEVFEFKNTEDKNYFEFMNRVDDAAVKLANENKNFYELTFSNKGGLVTPLIVEWTYEDGSSETEYIPAEIWRMNENEVKKVFVKDKKVVNIVIDPNEETADTNTEDNVFPRVEKPSDFDEFKSGSN